MNSARFWEGVQPRLICLAALIWAVSGSRQFWPGSETLIASANCIWNSSSKKLKLLLPEVSLSDDEGTSDDGEVEVNGWDGVVWGEGSSAGGRPWWWWSPMWSFRKKCFTFDIFVASHRSERKNLIIYRNIHKGGKQLLFVFYVIHWLYFWVGFAIEGNWGLKCAPVGGK